MENAEWWVSSDKTETLSESFIKNVFVATFITPVQFWASLRELCTCVCNQCNTEVIPKTYKQYNLRGSDFSTLMLLFIYLWHIFRTVWHAPRAAVNTSVEYTWGTDDMNSRGALRVY